MAEFKDEHTYLEWVRTELARVLVQRDNLAAALRKILENPDAKILDSDRKVGWAAIARARPR